MESAKESKREGESTEKVRRDEGGEKDGEFARSMD
jgi:hypothetical protein